MARLKVANEMIVKDAFKKLLIENCPNVDEPDDK